MREKRWEVEFLSIRGQRLAFRGPYRWKFQAQRAAARYSDGDVIIRVHKLPSKIYG